MVPVYICEDNLQFQKMIKREIETYCMLQEYEMEVVLVTADPQELIKRVNLNSQRSIYFLDVDLQHPIYNGFDLAREIRKADSRGFIIFVTTHDELAVETFKHRIEALDYIVKDDYSQLVTRLRESIDSIHQRLIVKEKKDAYFPVNILGESKYIPVDDILLFETSGQKHRVLLHTAKRTIEFFGSLGEIEKRVGEGFFRVHRSYLIPLDKITKVDFSENIVYLLWEHRCDLARNKKKELKICLEKREKNNG